jgi:hypothetical protein
LVNYTKITINNTIITKCGKSKMSLAFIHCAKFKMKTEGAARPDVVFALCHHICTFG